VGGKLVTKKEVPRGLELRIGASSESIRIKFMYRGMECRETLKLEHTKANIRYAERLRGEILNAIEVGTFDYSKYFPKSKVLQKLGIAPTAESITIGALVEDVMKMYSKTLAPSTIVAYRGSCNTHILPKWKDTLLSDLRPAALRAWIATFDMKARSVRQLMIPLRSALEQAVNDDLIEYNPLDRVKLGKILGKEAKRVEFVPDPFSADEINAILAACEGQERNIWLFAFTTGMRPSEIVALRWSSVDWVHGTVQVQRSRVRKITRDDTKTEAGKRTIDLRNGAYQALVAQKQFTALQDAEVFHDPRYNKGWTDYEPLGRRWDRALRLAGVRHRNQYQTRHTFASTLLSTGENPLYVAKQMGHRDTTMVIRTYGKWIEQEGGVLPDIYLRLARKRGALTR
jgi:integrase